MLGQHKKSFNIKSLVSISRGEGAAAIATFGEPNLGIPMIGLGIGKELTTPPRHP